MLIIVIYQLVTSSANGRNDVSGLSHHPIVKTLASFFLVSVAISIYGQTEAATTTTTRTIPSTNYTANFSSSTPITTIASSSALRTNNGSSNTTTNIPVVVLPSITSTATARVQTSTATPSGTLRFVVFAKHSNRLKQSIQSQVTYKNIVFITHRKLHSLSGPMHHENNVRLYMSTNKMPNKVEHFTKNL